MAKIEVVMPKMGESIIEATILGWSKKVGDKIEQDESLLEIATDKVDSEVPSPVDGKVIETRFNEGDVVPVGTVIAIIETEGAETSDSPAATPVETATANGQQTPASQQVSVATTVSAAVPAADLSSRSGSRFYSPLVLNIARTEGVSMDELERIEGTGNAGRVTKKDILGYLKSPNRGAAQVVQTTAPAVAETVAKVAQPTPKSAPATTGGDGFYIPKKTFSHSGEYEIVEMDRMRKMIAENMVYSKHTSAHVTSFVEADVTNIVLWRQKNKDKFEKKYGEKLTFTPIFIEAVARALREHPMVNVSVDGDKILVKKDINIGIAVALPTDNLIVPVIKNADAMNLFGLSKAVNDLANRARINKLKPDELEGGTYTLSNVGTFGNVMGTPVIMQPQVAILATGAIRKKPAVIETPAGDFIGVRHMMFLSHSYDHRVVDGALGGRFVRRVGDILENWDIDREI
jgi:2-oxoglutarate dehydrogenase E2 component (dihydrolipoamide succinyltransferase)